jgi:deoxyuridine 5'-triphosphate nucleotidohydrolase
MTVERIKAVGRLYSPKKPGDVGFDVEATADHFCPQGHIEMIEVDVRVQMPSRLWCSITGRSSMAAAGWVTIPGIIDSGYTGRVKVGLMSTNGNRWVKKGQRIAQLVFFQAQRPEIELVSSADEFRETERGTDGFGSTGE